jgi:hypothetical protein
LTCAVPVWDHFPMKLLQCVETSGKTFREFADEVGCSHNHLVQVAHLQKNLSYSLGLKITAFDARFSYAEQHKAFVEAEAARQEHAA